MSPNLPFHGFSIYLLTIPQYFVVVVVLFFPSRSRQRVEIEMLMEIEFDIEMELKMEMHQFVGTVRMHKLINSCMSAITCVCLHTWQVFLNEYMSLKTDFDLWSNYMIKLYMRFHFEMCVSSLVVLFFKVEFFWSNAWLATKMPYILTYIINRITILFCNWNCHVVTKHAIRVCEDHQLKTWRNESQQWFSDHSKFIK